ncbi:MAG: hypothetical protein QM778_10355 [Myxococcales bacterium]
MTKKKRPQRTRTLRRTLERSQDKLAGSRRKLVALERGGSPERPIEVDSAAVVEPRAESFRCPDCDGPLRAEEHTAGRRESQLVRAVHLICRDCGSPLTLYFRVVGPLLN